MKMKTVSLLAGVCVPLILGGPASGAFLGLKVVFKAVDPADIAADTNIPGIFNLLVANVYAAFTPGDAAAAVISVGGSAALGIPLQINTNDGTFFQHPLGNAAHLSPSAALANTPGFNTLKHDSFVTIGRKLDDDPIDGPDQTQVIGLDSWTCTQLTGSDEVKWFLAGFPAQGAPGQGADNPPDQVLIGQITIANFGPNAFFFGQMFVNGIHTNVAGVVEEFTIVGIFATGHSHICDGDLDGDGVVGVPDLLVLLAAWGTSPCGPPDIDGDGTVAVPDLLILLANWGPGPPGGCNL